MKPDVSGIMFNAVYDAHNRWRETHDYAFNNTIIELLRNRLSDDAQEYYEVHITKRLLQIPPELRCPRDRSAALSFRRFRGYFDPHPCEVCSFARAPSIAHIIPKAAGGPDDDWNLLHLCANHHYLFDRGLLSREEYHAIQWTQKGSEAQYFAERVRLEHHRRNWRAKGIA